MTKKKTALLLLHQFTFVGSPHIWNGDEMGMWGADDPDDRKPLTWQEYDFENETHFPFSNNHLAKPKFDTEWFEFHKSLIKMRKETHLFNLTIISLFHHLTVNLLAYSRIHDLENIDCY